MAQILTSTDNLITESENKENLINFHDLVPKFSLDDRSIERTYKAFDIEFEIDKLLKLSPDKRIWFALTEKETSKYNGAFNLYRSLLSPQTYHIHTYFPDIDAASLLTPEVFNSGYFVTKKNQKMKLFKFLLAKNYFTQGYVDKINQAKLPNKGVYFCISRNPVDFLFCSTNQSYSSCQSVESGGQGLGSLILDPNRILLFLTTGEKAKWKICGKKFIHFRYFQRSWGLLIEEQKKKKIAVIRYYPNARIPFTKIRISSVIKNITLKETNFRINSKSAYQFELPREKKGCPSFLYLDRIGLRYDIGTKKYYYQTRSGYTGYLCDFRREDGLNPSRDSIYDRPKYCNGCIICGSCVGVSTYNAYYVNLRPLRTSYVICNKHSPTSYKYCKKCRSEYRLPKWLENLCPYCTPKEEFENAISTRHPQATGS
jgi:hypothetical protein